MKVEENHCLKGKVSKYHIRSCKCSNLKPKKGGKRGRGGGKEGHKLANQEA